jgi:hypothetical protein
MECTFAIYRITGGIANPDAVFFVATLTEARQSFTRRAETLFEMADAFSTFDKAIP